MALLSDLDEDAKKALIWLSFKYRYLKRLKKKLNKLQEVQIDKETAMDSHRNKKAEKLFKKVYGKLLNSIVECEQMAHNYEENLDNDLKRLSKKLPENLKKECEDIDEKLKIAANTVLERTIVYLQRTKGEMEELSDKISLLKGKDINIYSDEAKQINQEIGELACKINEIIRNLSGWVHLLSSDIEEAKKFGNKLHVQFNINVEA